MMSVYEIHEEANGSEVFLTKKLRHWEGYTSLYPHHCRTIFKTGKIYLHDFLCGQHNYKLSLPETSESIRALEKDIVILRKEKKKFEEKHQIFVEKICHVKVIGRVGKAQKIAPNSFDPSFKRICYKGQKYNFGNIQASVIRQLYESANNGVPWQNGKRLLQKADSQSFTISNIFKRNPLWRHLIISDGRGSYRLDEVFISSIAEHHPVTS